MKSLAGVLLSLAGFTLVLCSGIFADRPWQLGVALGCLIAGAGVGIARDAAGRP